jgi:hypothetical protein
MMAVDLTTQLPFSAGKLEVLFEGDYESTPRSPPKRLDVLPYPLERQLLVHNAVVSRFMAFIIQFWMGNESEHVEAIVTRRSSDPRERAY